MTYWPNDIAHDHITPAEAATEVGAEEETDRGIEGICIGALIGLLMWAGFIAWVYA